MKTFLILINLAEPTQAKDIADYYRTVPDLAGWKGRICIVDSCEEIDRSRESDKENHLGKIEAKTGETAKAKSNNSTIPKSEIQDDSTEKLFSGLKGIINKSNGEFRIEIVYRNQKNDKDEDTKITIKVNRKGSH